MWWHAISSFGETDESILIGLGRQFSRLLAAEVCASAVVMLDTPCSELVWRIAATHSIRQFSLYFPSRASPCAITFQLESTTTRVKLWSSLIWTEPSRLISASRQCQCMLKLFLYTRIEERVINYYKLNKCSSKTRPVFIGRCLVYISPSSKSVVLSQEENKLQMNSKSYTAGYLLLFL